MTDFGEIIEPSSRAFWDDFDYDQENDNQDQIKHLMNVEWEWLSEDKKEPILSNVYDFYVIEGSGLQEFIQTTVIKGKPPIGGLKTKNILLYHIEKSFQIILISLENNLNISAVVAKYFENIIIRAQNVLTFSLQSKIHYKGDNIKDLDNKLVLLRGINSTIGYIEEIKSPNFITGVAAGVATLRFFNKLPFSSYIAYTDPLCELDGVLMQPILKLFRDINIKCDDKYKSRFKNTSLLYM